MVCFLHCSISVAALPESFLLFLPCSVIVSIRLYFRAVCVMPVDLTWRTDVVYVVDTGKVKEMQYDPRKRLVRPPLWFCTV